MINFLKLIFQSDNELIGLFFVKLPISGSHKNFGNIEIITFSLILLE